MISQCPQCGAPNTSSNQKCDYCGAEFFFKNVSFLASFDNNGIEKYLRHFKDVVRNDPNSIDGLLGLGLCYLKMEIYALAQKQFETVIQLSPDVSQAYYYLSLALIKKRRIMTLPLSEIRQIETFLRSAIQLNNSAPEFKLLLAMILKDYYEFNGMRVPEPGSNFLLLEVKNRNIDKAEIQLLKSTVKVAKEEQYYAQIK